MSLSSDYTHLRWDTDGSVLRVVLDHPTSPLNVVDHEMHTQLRQLFSELRRENEARAVLLTGSGKAFSAGGDFDWFPKLREPGAAEEVRRDGKQIIWDLLDIEIPVVCALNGPAIGLGASIALLCDSIFCARSATIADPHVRVGIVAGDGGAVIWPLALGPALAKRFLLTGDPISADEALRLGLVTHVVDDDELASEAMVFAQRLAAGAPLALRYTKIAVNQFVKQVLATSFDLSTSLELLTFRSDDHIEAVNAIKEKRPPKFEGR